MTEVGLSLGAKFLLSGIVLVIIGGVVYFGVKKSRSKSSQSSRGFVDDKYRHKAYEKLIDEAIAKSDIAELEQFLKNPALNSFPDLIKKIKNFLK
jgi:hypothetical protein